jgi:hypothetical protein
VEALTNRLSDWPRWLAQSAEPIFSAQQGLGQAHQRQAFAGAQAKLLQEAFDHTLPPHGAAGGSHQRLGFGADGGTILRRKRRAGEQIVHGLPLVAVLPVVEIVPIETFCHALL